MFGCVLRHIPWALVLCPGNILFRCGKIDVHIGAIQPLHAFFHLITFWSNLGITHPRFTVICRSLFRMRACGLVCGIEKRWSERMASSIFCVCNCRLPSDFLGSRPCQFIDQWWLKRYTCLCSTCCPHGVTSGSFNRLAVNRKTNNRARYPIRKIARKRPNSVPACIPTLVWKKRTLNIPLLRAWARKAGQRLSVLR